MEMTGYVYTCVGGDTFDSIAQELWNDEKYASELMCANPEYSTTTVFTGGETLYLPVVSIPDEMETVASEPEKAPWKE